EAQEAQRALDLDVLADPCFATLRFDAAVEPEGGAWDDAGFQRKAAPGYDIEELHLMVLSRPRVHHAGRARGEATIPFHGRHVWIPVAPCRHVGPDVPDPIRCSRRLQRRAVLSRH